METLKQPHSIGFEVTSRCNMKCVYCSRRYFSERHIGDMDFDIITKTIDAFPETKVISLNLYGEPLLYPRLFDAIKYAKDAGKWVTTTTNGLLMDAAVAQNFIDLELDRVIVSIDSACYDTFKFITKVDGGQVVNENIKRLWEMKDGKPEMYLGAVRCDENKHSTYIHYDIDDYCDSAGETSEKFSLPFQSPIVIPRTEPVECERPFRSMIIRFNGDVNLCCRDAFGAYPFGNVKDITAAAIWNGNMINIRKGMLTGTNCPMLCKLCKLEAGRENR